MRYTIAFLSRGRARRAKGFYLLVVALAAMSFMLASCKDKPTGPVEVPTLSVSPPNLDFSGAATQRTFEILNSGTGTLTWTASANQSWIRLSPNSGSQNGTVTVTVDQSGLRLGEHQGAIMVNSNGGTQSVAVSVNLALELIWSDPISSVNIGDTWEVFDENPSSGDDYWWGSSRSPFSGSYAAWCVGRGSNAGGDYDEDMSAWMRLKPGTAVNISNHKDIVIRFYMKYDTERCCDYVRFVLHVNGNWYYLTDRGEWKGLDYTYRQYEIRLTEFAALSPSASSLRFGFYFYSNGSNIDRGVWIDDIEVLGIRK